MLVILGCGESGMGAALLAHKLGIPIFVSDAGSIREDFRKQLIDLEIDFEENEHKIIFDFLPTLVVKSPGISDRSEVIQYYLQNSIDVISEIEFAFMHCKGKIIAITGSNGKTTTTNLIFHILKTAKYSVSKVGNVGYSFARSLSEAEFDYYVIEVSSFQLDTIKSFRPFIAIILNITPDHLDRYEYKFENYVNSKFKIALNQNNDNHIILYRDKTIIDNYRTFELRSTIHWVQSELNHQDEIIINEQQGPSLKYSVLKGRHNAMNVSCSVIASQILGIDNNVVQLAIDSFKNDPHRLEYVASIEGVDYINDSKATNVDSVYWALDAMKSKIVWIAGGQDKGNNYSVILPLIQEKVKTLVALGVNNQKLIDFFSPYIPVLDTHSMTECVEQCMNIASSGDKVLLSPACASFDLFKNYQDRGDQFKNAVINLKETRL
ncbi:MAG: UDP-N-acetylmuramoyl-L-alanine--D-glutamate ligase [Saprospiraceae bacterium]|nr:UDP-N-acetylmuramoyl-L-alanine--D-glutamate ligase [Saprospiraceae bacterium]